MTENTAVTQALPTKEDIKLRSDFFKGMSKFRSQIEAPKKNGHVDFTGKKGRTKYDYILLDDLIKAIDKALKGTQLSWRQETTNQDSGVSVRTIIDCDTGYEYKSPWLTLRTNGMPQDVGSAITYAKRYSLGTTFGVNSEADDDGQEAEKVAESKPASQRKPINRSTNSRASQSADPNAKAKQDLKVRLKSISAEMKMTEKKLLVNAAGKAKVKDLSHMTREDINALDHELSTELMEFRQAQRKDTGKVSEAGDDFLDHLDVDV
ncbi:single-stranded DNA-binding protein [Lentilactobacillus fungorum]|uniref:Single-stranded DNA-binding protein n=1 Tax=Lentilactobacillus fungorum TaxID=2201250 RepID=A0ABQ3VXE3_9LACO|nr:ERF family protein [Lentilactobacillus fungorum]GHP13004.1 single-stranded DNA-binding protein [Lentilactobacillus fungorum]